MGFCRGLTLRLTLAHLFLQEYFLFKDSDILAKITE